MMVFLQRKPAKYNTLKYQFISCCPRDRECNGTQPPGLWQTMMWKSKLRSSALHYTTLYTYLDTYIHTDIHWHTVTSVTYSGRQTDTRVQIPSVLSQATSVDSQAAAQWAPLSFFPGSEACVTSTSSSDQWFIPKGCFTARGGGRHTTVEGETPWFFGRWKDPFFSKHKNHPSSQQKLMFMGRPRKPDHNFRETHRTAKVW